MVKCEVYITEEGDLDARCKSCHDIPRLEYLGFDPVYPHFKIVCDRCGSWTTMTFRLICHGLAGVPYRYPWDTESAVTRAAQHTRLQKAAKGRKP